jgi:hypothetical protein
MPSIYISKFTGDYWSKWEKSTVLSNLPGFASEQAKVLLASCMGEEQCFVYDPDKELLSWSSWVDEDWLAWSEPIHLPLPPNIQEDPNDTYLSIVSSNEGQWMISINFEFETVYWKIIGDNQPWDGPSYLEPPPNLDDSTEIFVANDNYSEWIVAINLEDQSIYYAESDEDEYSEWEQIRDLELPDNWLEIGIDLDGAIYNDQLALYAIVYDDDFVTEEDDEAYDNDYDDYQ